MRKDDPLKPSPGEERRVRRAASRRLQILAASRRLLLDRADFTSVTMDEIAKASDVSKGTLYNFFESRDDLYGTLACEVSRRCLEALLLIEFTDDQAKNLEAVARTYLIEYANRSDYRYLAEYCQRSNFREHLGPRVRAEVDEIASNYTILFARAFRGSNVSALRFLVVESSLVGAIRSIWNGRVKALDIAPFAEELATFLVRGNADVTC